MKYKILKIKSKSKLRERILLACAILVFFVCIMSSHAFPNMPLPEFFFDLHLC